MEARSNNQFTITYAAAPVPAGADEVSVTLDASVHPIGRTVDVVANGRGANVNMNVFVKSVSKSTGSWVITFGLSAVSDGTTETFIDYIVYTSVV